MADWWFQSCCNTDVVDAYFEKVLFLELLPDSVIMLDNPRFHQSPITLKLLAATGGQTLFLLSYSPDLNPIECLWPAIKNRLRQNFPTVADHFLLISNIRSYYC